MDSISQLNARFAIPGRVSFASDQGGMTRAVVTAPACEAHIFLHGAHVTHYHPAGGQPLLFLSSKSSSGLEGRTYIDKVDQMRRKIQGKDLRITGETDRVYLDSNDPVVVAEGRRSITIEKENSRSTVIWNPWIQKAKSLSDLGDDEWREMLCVETANVADNQIVLPPRGVHAMKAKIAPPFR